ncbi:phosphate ABC transporter ATP-binding protein [Pseudoflavonifractor sp. MSJ-37]|uniref:phosphate ABC transporter ATP-binding protein n=1 Tax=Pseudoflavonifractor sp. MSJ-37 TaxID=2841531 RepID=UPI001C11858F|nr:phosphate ABC transporter ATP-binding protein [Pseudoflavonifractor sp. MSJ-37]MBU5434095.1 phosphate ABC transporter ATP-binding protein [Pseudoflavonifractor sp. MSJ-37]
MDPILTLRGVSAAYDGTPALTGIDLDIPERQITAIIGPSGCGKSTLLRCMDGLLLEEPDTSVSGDIRLDGTDIRSLRREDLRRRVGLVFQTPTPFPFSIYRNLTYAPQYYGIRDKKALDALVRETLETVGLYDEVKDDLQKSARKLSGGQQQRLCIARALTARPEVLLLDEPCSALDVKSIQVIESLLLRLREQYTIVIVTHNLAQARRIADQVVFLNDGRLVETGDGPSFFAAPQQEEARAFLSGEFG